MLIALYETAAIKMEHPKKLNIRVTTIRFLSDEVPKGLRNNLTRAVIIRIAFTVKGLINLLLRTFTTP
ncbi:hypothetical protein LJR153_003387 [Paenibacillus sp. LjRoot153]